MSNGERFSDGTDTTEEVSGAPEADAGMGVLPMRPLVPRSGIRSDLVGDGGFGSQSGAEPSGAGQTVPGQQSGHHE